MSAPDLTQETIQLANTLKAITDKGDPETRKAALELIQKKVPGTNFTELQTDRLEKSVEKRFEELEHRQSQRELQSNLESQRQSLISRGYSEDDVKKIETDVMQKHGIADYSVAAKVFDADQPAPQPSYDIRGVRPWKAESLQSFMKNPKDKAREVAQQVAAEFRQSPNKRFG